MKETWVLSDDERNARKLRRRSEKGPMFTKMSVLHHELDTLLSTDREVKNHFPITSHLAEGIEFCSRNGNETLGHDAFITLYHLSYTRIVEFFGNTSMFYSLPVQWKRNLWKENLDALTNIRLSCGFNSDGSGNLERQLLLLRMNLHNALQLKQIFFPPWTKNEM